MDDERDAGSRERARGRAEAASQRAAAIRERAESVRRRALELQSQLTGGLASTAHPGPPPGPPTEEARPEAPANVDWAAVVTSLRSRTADLLERLGRSADMFASYLEKTADRGDRERRLGTAAAERRIADMERRNADRLRVGPQPGAAGLGLERVPPLPPVPPGPASQASDPEDRRGVAGTC